jgi:hypothetical protein
MRRFVLLAVAVAMAVGVSACGGGATIPVQRLSSLVLTESDLPQPFAPFFVGRQSNLDATSDVRADASRFGRKDGWIARFHRSGTRATRGPLVVVSRADLFGDSGGAKKDLEAYAYEFGHEPGAEQRTLKPPPIGDQAIAGTFVQPGPKPVRFVVVAWRYRNVSASVSAEGFDGRISLADVVRLAQLQQRRIARA